VIKIQRAKEDILPITAFRTQLSTILKQLEERKHPILLTHNGRATAVLLNIQAYEDLMSDFEVAQSVISGLMGAPKGQVEVTKGVKVRTETKKEVEK
jgi:prevent-host-death family protein